MGMKSRKHMYLNFPMEHWELKAKELVIDCLVRASSMDTNSIIGEIASKRLLELAKAEDKKVFNETLKAKNHSAENFAILFNNIFAK